MQVIKGQCVTTYPPQPLDALQHSIIKKRRKRTLDALTVQAHKSAVSDDTGLVARHTRTEPTQVSGRRNEGRVGGLLLDRVLGDLRSPAHHPR
jgi:hypothetical protein